MEETSRWAMFPWGGGKRRWSEMTWRLPGDGLGEGVKELLIRKGISVSSIVNLLFISSLYSPVATMLPRTHVGLITTMSLLNMMDSSTPPAPVGAGAFCASSNHLKYMSEPLCQLVAQLSEERAEERRAIHGIMEVKKELEAQEGSKGRVLKSPGSLRRRAGASGVPEGEELEQGQGADGGEESLGSTAESSRWDQPLKALR